MSPRVRLLVLVGTLAALFTLLAVTDVVTKEGIRAQLEPLGAAAPLAFVALAVVLGLLLVPGAVLAAAAGLLFGPLLGAAVSLTAATLNATLALLIARRTGRPGVAELSGVRLRALSAALERHGLAAVIAQRLAPGVPDGPLSYAAGLLGVGVAQIALGTLIGAAPRALSYATIGAGLDDLTSPLALAGIAGLVLSGIVGAFLVHRVLRGTRRPRG